MKRTRRLLIALLLCLGAIVGCDVYFGASSCREYKKYDDVLSGTYLNETKYWPLHTPPPTSSTDSSPVTDTADWPEPVSTVLIVDREAGTVVMRHTEPDGRVVERLFRVPTREDIAAQYYDEGP